MARDLPMLMYWYGILYENAQWVESTLVSVPNHPKSRELSPCTDATLIFYLKLADFRESSQNDLRTSGWIEYDEKIWLM